MEKKQPLHVSAIPGEPCVTASFSQGPGCLREAMPRSNPFMTNGKEATVHLTLSMKEARHCNS
jgi:hypothetical protein